MFFGGVQPDLSEFFNKNWLEVGSPAKIPNRDMFFACSLYHLHKDRPESTAKISDQSILKKGENHVSSAHDMKSNKTYLVRYIDVGYYINTSLSFMVRNPTGCIVQTAVYLLSDMKLNNHSLSLEQSAVRNAFFVSTTLPKPAKALC